MFFSYSKSLSLLLLGTLPMMALAVNTQNSFHVVFKGNGTMTDCLEKDWIATTIEKLACTMTGTIEEKNFPQLRDQSLGKILKCSRTVVEDDAGEIVSVIGSVGDSGEQIKIDLNGLDLTELLEDDYGPSANLDWVINKKGYAQGYFIGEENAIAGERPKSDCRAFQYGYETGYNVSLTGREPEALDNHLQSFQDGYGIGLVDGADESVPNDRYGRNFRAGCVAGFTDGEAARDNQAFKLGHAHGLADGTGKTNAYKKMLRAGYTMGLREEGEAAPTRRKLRVHKPAVAVAKKNIVAEEEEEEHPASRRKLQSRCHANCRRNAGLNQQHYRWCVVLDGCDSRRLAIDEYGEEEQSETECETRYTQVAGGTDLRALVEDVSTGECKIGEDVVVEIFHVREKCVTDNKIFN